jgi:hypothetical protein
LPDLYGHVRSSAADREHTIEVLKTAFAEGRLTSDECEQRVGLALGPLTYAELAALTADLPAGLAGSLSPTPRGYLPASAPRPMNWMAVASLICAVIGGLFSLLFVVLVLRH